MQVVTCSGSDNLVLYRLTSYCHDEAARFVHVLTKGARTYLTPDDFEPLVQVCTLKHSADNH